MQLSIGHKLSLIVMLLFGLHLGAFGLTQYRLAVYRRDTLRLANESMPQAEALSQLEVSAAHIVQHVSLYLASGDAHTTTELELDITTARQQVQALRATADRFTVAASGQASPMDLVERDLEALVQQARALTIRQAQQDLTLVQRDTLTLREHAQALNRDLLPLQQMISEDQTAATQAVQSNPLVLPAILTTLIAAIVLALLWVVRTTIVRPIQQLTTATASIAAGATSGEVHSSATDEIGVLAQSFNHMVRTVQRRTQDLEAQYSAAAAARQVAEAAHVQITDQLATIEAQSLAIQEMSVPLLPISTTTVLMPLVGALDSARLSLIQERALEAIQQNAIQWLILDVTGVPFIDSAVAQGLLQVVLAARLLGSRAILVGIRPEVAQAMVSLGVELSEIVTHRSLESATMYTQTQPKRALLPIYQRP